MLNKLKFNTLSLSFLFLMFVLAWGTTTAFAAETTIYNPSFVMTANGDHVERNITDSQGNRGLIGIECIKKTATSKTWKVYHYGIISCDFIITVSNNQIISACCGKIVTTFGTYSNASFDWNSHCAKLSFQFTSYLNLVSGNCWLKTCVTGSYNDINFPDGSF